MFTAMLSFLLDKILFFMLYFEGSSFPKPLSQKEEEVCFELMKNGDKNAREELIKRNLRLVAHIVKKYYPKQDEQDDLISIGTIGLIKAVNTFDIEKKARFATYASRCIENEILMQFRSQKKTKNNIYLEDVIDNDSEGNSLSVMDVIADDNLVDEQVENKEEVTQLFKKIESRLSARERQILKMRFGLCGTEALSQQRVADILKISRSYVSRLEKKAIEKLRKTS